MPELIFKQEVYAIVGAAMDVHRENGFGFSEPVYQECLELELASRKIPFVPQKEMSISYKGHPIKKTYVADLIVYDKIIFELKALDKLTSREEAQVINYLKVSKLEIGVLINFGAASLEWKRIVLTNNRTAKPIDLQPLKNSRSFA
jgi:GxxExxY protein